MKKGDLFLDKFKQATSVAIKALGRKKEIEVAFATRPKGGSEKRIVLPEIAEDLFISRGAADAAALKLLHHDPEKFLPFLDQAENPALLIALEEARCEALGSIAMKGVAHNLEVWKIERLSLRQAQETNASAFLADALHVVAYEKFASLETEKGNEIVALWRPFIEARGAGRLVNLSAVLNKPAAFYEEALRLLKDLAPDDVEKPQEPSAKPTPVEDSAQAKDEEKKDEEKSETPQETPSPESSGTSPDADEQQGQEAGQIPAASTVETEPAFGPATTYRIFTTHYDETVLAEDLCPAPELSRLRSLLDQRVEPLAPVIARLANRLQRQLMAQQARHWDFDLEEGTLDAARLARIVIHPLQSLSFKQEKDAAFRDTVVTLLLDNSGSMRGRPITLTALCADILSRTLERCGVKVEILGFTTRAWKGGQPRNDWTAAGKPPLPGRLNELRHIIYKAADVPVRRARKNLGLMLREGLLKENIDGEALLWAARRLLRRSEKRRILLVISDGAPVDDSTLAVNPVNYLEEHLRSVIEWIERSPLVQLVAIGIGHDVTPYYRRAVTIKDVNELGGAMVGQLADLFRSDEGKRRESIDGKTSGTGSRVTASKTQDG
jgi:cobaltochelatase CobT